MPKKALAQVVHFLHQAAELPLIPCARVHTRVGETTHKRALHPELRGILLLLLCPCIFRRSEAVYPVSHHMVLRRSKYSGSPPDA